MIIAKNCSDFWNKVSEKKNKLLYTYIFDAEDNDEFISVDSDGLGTVSVFEPIADVDKLMEVSPAVLEVLD